MFSIIAGILIYKGKADEVMFIMSGMFDIAILAMIFSALGY